MKGRTHQSNSDDVRNVEVGSDGRKTSANEVGLVGLEPVHLVLVLLRVDGHAPDSHFHARPEHADCNLTCAK